MPKISWNTPKVAAAVGATVLAGGAIVGVASAQTPTPTTPEQRHQEHLNRFAQNLGVSPAQVTEAMKKTALQFVDEALAAGKITAEQAQQARDRINSGEFGKFGGPGGAGRHGGPGGERRGGPGGMLGVAHEALAQFLGVTPEQLHTDLQGKSLADVAAAHGKSADALKQFIVDGAQTRLNEAVTNGRLTQDQATRLLDELKSHLDDFINKTHDAAMPGMPGRRPHGPGQQHGGPGSFFQGPAQSGSGA